MIPFNSYASSNYFIIKEHHIHSYSLCIIHTCIILCMMFPQAFQWCWGLRVLRYTIRGTLHFHTLHSPDWNFKHVCIHLYYILFCRIILGYTCSMIFVNNLFAP
ncbi:hypothetical protein L210DRAFT_3584934 [Boletus edulis BED1]|uniref:Uncharacterized protein n=1 Tax=Boletus edulis BED1 TaxID=1328754 RepID=A0AAD4G5T4_BOLED|nr:hypothetical protein L210DRAFT_3584934 [Boletus edulis BED1]